MNHSSSTRTAVPHPPDQPDTQHSPSESSGRGVPAAGSAPGSHQAGALSVLPSQYDGVGLVVRLAELYRESARKAVDRADYLAASDRQAIEQFNRAWAAAMLQAAHLAEVALQAYRGETAKSEGGQS